jgi:hypothetical protein
MYVDGLVGGLGVAGAVGVRAQDLSRRRAGQEQRTGGRGSAYHGSRGCNQLSAHWAVPPMGEVCRECLMDLMGDREWLESRRYCWLYGRTVCLSAAVGST